PDPGRDPHPGRTAHRQKVTQWSRRRPESGPSPLRPDSPQGSASARDSGPSARGSLAGRAAIAGGVLRFERYAGRTGDHAQVEGLARVVAHAHELVVDGLDQDDVPG